MMPDAPTSSPLSQISHAKIGVAGYLRRWTQAQTSPGPKLEDVAGYNDDDVKCKACESEESVAELMLCDGYDRGFHIFYLCPILLCGPAGYFLNGATRVAMP
jgi:[histone H3]-lysine27 N-methyltransferase